MCGEKPTESPRWRNTPGSPPRVRGKDKKPFRGDDTGGITPACAGKSFGSRRWGTTARDHPRVCGEKCPQSRRAAASSGSPPRVRGKVRLTRPMFSNSRITPACAGKSASVAAGMRVGRGSPPRVRGKVSFAHHLSTEYRITPACAGKSLERYTSIGRCQDHPRVCGEKISAACFRSLPRGSPPRVRGKASRGISRYLTRRITPACAGKRLKRSLLIPQKQHFHLFFVRFHLTSHTA